MNTPSFLPAPTPESLAEFRAIYQERFGRTLSKDQARQLASNYLLLYYLGSSKGDKVVDKEI